MKPWILLALLGLAWRPALAELPVGSLRVSLEAAGGESVELGRLEIERSGGEYRFDFSLEEASFSDQFLSMRPFKCIDGKIMYCRLAYPYERPPTVTAASLINLEYEFLFIVRSPTGYGIDPYNGRYYVLRVDGASIVGEPKAVDLNLLAAPPDAGVTHPITEAELDFIEVESERFARLVIR